MKIIAALFALLLSFSAAHATELSEKDQNDIRAQITDVMGKYNAGDSHALVDAMPPSAVELFGGRATMLHMVASVLQQQKANNVVFEKFEPTKIDTPIMAGETTIVFVTTDIAMKLRDKHVTGTGFMIASRAKETDKWQLLGGDGINRNPEILQKIYKGFPAGVSLPTVKYDVN